MSEYELADQVEKWGNDFVALSPKGGACVIEAAKMLRHQANRIKELEAKHRNEFDYAEKLLKERG